MLPLRVWRYWSRYEYLIVNGFSEIILNIFFWDLKNWILVCLKSKSVNLEKKYYKGCVHLSILLK